MTTGIKISGGRSCRWACLEKTSRLMPARMDCLKSRLPGRPNLRRHCRSNGDATTAALLQTGRQIRIRRHGETIPCEPEDRILRGSCAGGRSGRGRGGEGDGAGGERRGGFGDHAFIRYEEVWRGGDPRSAAGTTSGRIAGELERVF